MTYPERDADESYLAELQREVRFRGINIPVSPQLQEGGVGQGVGVRTAGARVMDGIDDLGF